MFLTTARRGLLVGLALVGGLILGAVAPAPAQGRVGAGPKLLAASVPRRVLIIAAPRLTWPRLLGAQAPQLRHLFDTGTVASLSVRGFGPRSNPVSGYATLSAGNRATGSSQQDRAAVESTNRSSADRPAGIAVPDVGAMTAVNGRRLYGTQPGLLGDTLVRHGYSTAVVANADQADLRPATSTALPTNPEHRAAAIGLMDRQGLVGAGEVGPRLVGAAPALSPLHLGLDRSEVTAAFDRVWRDRAVVLVELSDIERADAVAPGKSVAERAAADQIVERAVAYDDAIVGHLLRAVGPGDLVMVVNPVAPRSNEQLTPFAIMGPGFSPGLAESGTTRRLSYVALVDVAPTILQTLGIPAPDHMTGTAIRTARRTDPGAQLHRLADEAALALFHNRALGPLNILWSATLYALVAAALVVLALPSRYRRRRGPRWAREVTKIGLLSIAAYPIPAFLIGLFPYDRLGSRRAVAAVLVTSAVVVALLVRLLGARRGHGRPAVAAVLAPFAIAVTLAGLLAVDLLTGSRMQIDTVFGYSPIGAGRFAGYGNQAYSFLIASTIVIVCGGWAMAHDPTRPAAEHDIGGRDRWLYAAAGLFALVTVLVGLPSLGAKVGGTFATLPTAALVLFVLAGRRLSFRRLALTATATVLLLAGFAALDLTRPTNQQTHLGRLVHTALHGGTSMGSLAIQRKIHANVTLLNTWWLPSLLGAIATIVIVSRLRPMRAVEQRAPGATAARVGIITAGAIAMVLADSGVSMPATMAGIYLPFLLFVLLQTDDPVHGLSAPVAPGPVGDLAAPHAVTTGQPVPS